MRPRNTPALLLASLAALAAPLAGQGRSQRVVIQADAVWVDAETLVSPAWIILQGDQVLGVSPRRPQRFPGQVVEVKGTVAAGLVDAWSTLVPFDVLTNRRQSGVQDLKDSLPADLPGADPSLAARVAAVRRGGVVAGYLAPGGNNAEKGLSTAVVLGRNDLPVAAGREFLEFAIGSTRGGVGELVAAEVLADRFKAAADRRLALDDYQEKLEKFEKDLEEYRKKLEEYAKKKAGDKDQKGGAEGGNGGGAMAQQRGRRGPPPSRVQGQGQGQQPPEQQGSQAPKRPQRPQAPRRDEALDRILRAIEGELPVRVEAHRVEDLARLVELKEQYDLDLVVAGAEEADLIAPRLAEAGIPVVLAAEPAFQPARGAPARSFAGLYRALADAGVTVAIAGGSDGGSALLLMRAGEAIAAGADPAGVWASLTAVPAEILGLDSSHGSVRSGRSSDLILFEGASPFDASRPLKIHQGGGRFE